MTPREPLHMNIVGHDLIEKHLNHSRSESFPLVVAVGPLGHGMGQVFPPT